MKPLKFNLKILLIVLVAVLISTLLCGGTLVLFADRTLREKALQDNWAIADGVARQVDSYLLTVEQYAETLSLDDQIQTLILNSDRVRDYTYFRTLRDIEQHLNRVRLLGDQIIDDIYILCGNDRVVTSQGVLRAERYSPQDDWYLRFEATGARRGFSLETVTVSGNGRGSDLEVFHYVVDMYNLRNPREKLGTLVLSLKCDALSGILGGDGARFSDFALLPGGGGALFGGQSWAEWAEEGRKLSGTRGAYRFASEYLFSIPLYKQGYTMLGRMPVAAVEEHFAATVRLLLYAVIASLIFVSAGALLVIYRITKPLVRMYRGIAQVAAGDLDARLDIRSGDELSDIANAFNGMTQNVKKLIEERVQQEKRQQELKLRLFMAQINPHFICNTLNAVIYRAQALKESELVLSMRAFVSILQGTINIYAPSTLSVREEMSFLDNYMQVLRFRYSNLRGINWRVNPEAYEKSIPRMLLYPIVENSVFHGMLAQRADGEIGVMISLEDERLQIDVSDNGVGMDEEALNRLRGKISDERESGLQRHGVGLKNVYSRLRLRGEAEDCLRIDSRPGGGTRVSLRIDIQGTKP